MKTYISAELEVVVLSNDIIATSGNGIGIGNPAQGGDTSDAPTRRSIWN